MPRNEKSGPEVAYIASRLLKNPTKATLSEIQSLAASVLTQSPDQPKPPSKPAKKGR